MMKKIIAAFDGLDFSNATLQYAVEFSKLIKAHLVGVFLEDFTYHGYRFADVLSSEGGVSDEKIKKLDERDKQLRDSAVDRFENTCRQENINFNTHRDRNIALQELLSESIYADLLIVNKKETFNRFDRQTPTVFLSDLLADMQCPVLIVPDYHKPVEKIILLYDGEPSSVFAVKMFSYLMPTLRNHQVEVLTIKDEDSPLSLPNSRLMKEFMKRHYPSAGFVIEKGDAEDGILKYLRVQKENVLVVLGAYQRGRVSRWFKPSMADRLMRHLTIPLFIAHNKP